MNVPMLCGLFRGAVFLFDKLQPQMNTGQAVADIAYHYVPM